MSLLGIPSTDQINQIVDRAAAQIGTLEQTEIDALKAILAEAFADAKQLEAPVIDLLKGLSAEITQIRSSLQGVIDGGIHADVTFGARKQ